MMVAITLAAFAGYLAWRRYATWRHTVAADIRWWATARQQVPAVGIPDGRRTRDLARLAAPTPQFQSPHARPPA